MVEWIRYGPLLLRLWTRDVGFGAALRGCAWVIARKALPRQKALARALMPRSRTLELKVAGHANPHDGLLLTCTLFTQF